MSGTLQLAETDTPITVSPYWFHRLAGNLFFSRGFLALCDQGVISIANFLTGLAIGRLSGKSELGLYALCWTIVCVAVDLSGALTTTPYTVFSPRMQDGERKRYIGNMFVLHCAITITVAACIVVGANFFLRGPSGYGLFRALLSTAAALAFLNAREFTRRICFADMAIGLTLVLDAIFTLIYFIALLLLRRTNSLTASSVYLLLGGTALVQTAAWLLLYRKKICFSSDWWSEGLQNWHFAKWVLGSGLLWTLATYLYPWMLAAYHGTLSTGLWASCSAIVAVGNPVLGGLVNYLGPKLSTIYASSGLESMRRYVYKSSVGLVLILSPFALVLSFFGTRIMTSLYGPAYTGTQTTLVLLSLNLLALSFSHPFARGLFTLKAAKADMLVNIMAVILLFAVGFMAVKYYSVTGAAAALLLSTLATAVLRLAVFSRTASLYAEPAPHQWPDAPVVSEL